MPRLGPIGGGSPTIRPPPISPIGKASRTPIRKYSPACTCFGFRKRCSHDAVLLLHFSAKYGRRPGLRFARGEGAMSKRTIAVLFLLGAGLAPLPAWAQT